uniref:Matrix-remodeling-associated protein 7 helical domain-containing protein n=1 Tax=Meloidogyne enterolobii TaxID=390850 RepID=A0A6V7VBP8_MELEN|nr:unnamed protein product [Meloidogyne enterolobii]
MEQQKPITNLFDALKQIFIDPKLLSLYGITFIVALILPFVMSFVLRKWNDYKRAKLIKNSKLPPKIDEDDETVKLPDGMTGFFNKSLMESFRQNAKNSGILRDENCPFISRDDLVVIKEEDLGENKKNEVNEVSKNLKSEEEKEEENINYCEGKDDEKMPLLEDINSPPNKKEKKKRKQFKDPDPETAQALNKLVENGLHGKLATAQLRVKTQMLEQSMSEEERIKEQEIRQKQLAEIFQMMEAQKEKFGIEAKEEVVEQMKLYSL